MQFAAGVVVLCVAAVATADLSPELSGEPKESAQSAALAARVQGSSYAGVGGGSGSPLLRALTGEDPVHAESSGVTGIVRPKRTLWKKYGGGGGGCGGGCGGGYGGGGYGGGGGGYAIPVVVVQKPSYGGYGGYPQRGGGYCNTCNGGGGGYGGGGSFSQSSSQSSSSSWGGRK